MKQSLRLFIVGSVVALPLLAMARSYDTSHLSYSDAPSDRASQVAISVLTEEGILEGNPDGTFRPDTPLNRAEFMQIAIRLLPPGTVTMNRPCFPDVPTNMWYSIAVCRAKASGIVRGNAVEGTPESEWRFEPTRAVQYEEAVKVLVGIYSLPTGKEETGVDMLWYEPFINAAKAQMLTLSGVRVGENITRGEMARLVANFYASSHGELDLLHDAQDESSSSSSSSRSSSPTSSSRSSTSSSSSSSPVTLDPLPSTTVRNSLILLGENSSILASANIFSNSEPLNVDSFFVDIANANTSISGFLVYNEDKHYLGRATVDTSVSGNTRYRLNVKNKGIQIGHKQEYSFYVRAETRDPDEGGINGATVEVEALGLTGTGEWSSDAYSQSTNEAYPVSETANAVITSITNAGPATDPLVPGPTRLIAEFDFAGKEGTSSADLRVTGLSFYLATSGGITVSNLQLRVPGVSDSHSCSLSSNVVTCSSIPAGFGSIANNAPLNIELYGDISIPSGASSASLQVTLIEPGNPSSAGAVTWTDGDETFSWVAGDSPVARGTYYSF